jgi:hypothetical protein
MKGMRNSRPAALTTIEIDPALTRPSAIVAAMLGAGHAAIAGAAGATWEGEEGLAFAPEVAAHAGRMALLWQRTARHLQYREQRTRRSRPQKPGDPAQSDSAECRIGRQAS